MADLISNMWYVAMHGGELARGRMESRMLLGQPMVIGRGSDGKVFALMDFCPHRGVPLRYGRFDGAEIECCYHGWRFDCEGRCTAIPALPEDSQTDISRIRTPSYPARESEGLVWVYVPATGSRTPETLPEVPLHGLPAGAAFSHVATMDFPCDIDHAVLGLMDPSHGPYVHASWWWRSQRSMHLKEKKFAPHGLGFRMLSHAPSSNSRAYKLLSGKGERRTEITFQLPGLRSEHIRAGRHDVVLLTALTPVDAKNTVLHQLFYSTIPAVNAMKPLLARFGRRFIRQDLDIVMKQQEGLAHPHPSLMLLGDADAQALWYHKLKRDYLKAQAEKIPFENRLPEKTLRWRS